MKKSKEQIKKLEKSSKEKIVELEHTLTTKETKYWRIIKPTSGVLFLKGAPGTAKSAIIKAIADKLNLHFLDLRLSTMAAEDLGSYPYPLKTDDGRPFLTQLNPSWMVEAVDNKLEDNNGWLIFFDELNRAPLDVRNAALRVLLERTSNDLEFPKFIYMASAGNLGADDGTQVEELDGALRSRLIKISHDLTLPEWREAFANEHVHPYIVKFLDNKPGSFVSSDIEADVIANARTWTFLSDYLIANFGFDSTPNDFLRDIESISRSFVGNESTKFIRWCEDNMKLTIKDILRSRSKEKLIAKLKATKQIFLTELLNESKTLNLEKLTDLQYANLVMLIKANQDETIVEYMTHIGETIDLPILKNRKTRVNYLLRVDLEYWKDIVITKAKITNDVKDESDN